LPAYQPHESIEGNEIHGHSRDPIRYQRAMIVKGIKCFVFKTEFNVGAEIITVLAPGTPTLGEKPLTAKGDTLGSDTAVILSIALNRTHKNISHVTHTHGANIWEFKQQTNVKVITPRQEIINAQQKRLSIPKANSGEE
jgi:hypothetical protein